MFEGSGSASLFEFIFLGCGTSTGVPMIGCDCKICLSDDPKNSRTRPSVLIKTPQGNILIDTSPEMRLQLLREKPGPIHAIIYTHAHADHLFGLDDSRLFSRLIDGQPVPIYCEAEVEQHIRTVFSYAFADVTKKNQSGYVPKLTFQTIEPFQAFDVLGYEILPIRLDHGRFKVLGFRMGDLAYCTDVNRIPEQSMENLKNLDVLIIDALRHEKHPTHFSLQEALNIIEMLKPRRAILTHMSHTLDYETVSANLPPNVVMAYDGMKFTWQGIAHKIVTDLNQSTQVDKSGHSHEEQHEVA